MNFQNSKFFKYLIYPSSINIKYNYIIIVTISNYYNNIYIRLIIWIIRYIKNLFEKNHQKSEKKIFFEAKYFQAFSKNIFFVFFNSIIPRWGGGVPTEIDMGWAQGSKIPLA